MTDSSLLFPPLTTCTVAVIGLGYVGFPLAVEFSKIQACRRSAEISKRRVIGFDINYQRLSELKAGFDRTNETTQSDLNASTDIHFTSEISDIATADVFIVTVPTPIDSAKRPDLQPLEKASTTVGRALKVRADLDLPTVPVVIFESTVFPGATEEVCVPIIEKESCLAFNEGFFCGYSPERINPGDKEHRLTTVTKVTSGSTANAADWVDNFYGSIIEAGTHKTSSIKVAEAAKVIENTQRDLNIALMNELAIIFHEMNIDTLDVLEAAGTKWNFSPFRPGLVGGHCIGVDPYYLTHKAEQLGYHPQIVLAGRRINDGMSRWIVEQLVLGLARRGSMITGARVLVLGLTFKENCPDLRNTRILDMLDNLDRYAMDVVVVDPWVDIHDLPTHSQICLKSEIPFGQTFNVVMVAVGHHQFAEISLQEWRQLLAPGGVFVDLKGCMPRELDAFRL